MNHCHGILRASISVFLVGLGCLAGLGCGGDGATGSGHGSGASAGSDPGGSGPGGGGAGTTTGTAGNTPGGLFEAPEPWTKDVSDLQPDARSDDIIAALDFAGGWGADGTMQITFGIALLWADASTPRQTVTGHPEGYCYGGPDCDPVPLEMPIPPDGNTEDSPDYYCVVDNYDCHVLVAETDEKKLYELYNATQVANGFSALGAFVWDLTKAYPDDGRGDQCTSADAAGFPLSALLPTADEVASGEMHHAIRFILPNDRMKADVYVHPASHAGSPMNLDPNAPPYGVRFRLKAGFDESGFSDGERVILKAMKTYGMLLSDGGQIALTFADDRLSTAKWSDLGISEGSFDTVSVTDFEVVDLGPEIPLTYDCVLNP